MKLKRISTNIILLGIVSFINDLSSEMIMPILPMFITALGGAGLVVGLIGGLRASVGSILKVVCGYWSDKTGRRKAFVLSGYLTSSVFKLFLAFSSVWQHILIFAGLERMGKGLRTAPRDAIIADSMRGERGKGFGIHRAMDTSGAILGSAVVFMLFWFLGFNFKTIIFIAAIVGFFSLIPLYYVKEHKAKVQKTGIKISIRNLPHSLRLFILIAGIFDLVRFNYMFFILKAHTAFTAKLSIGAPILLYIVFNIFYAIFSIPAGRLSDKIGRGKIIVFGYILFSLVCFGFAFFDSLAAFIVLFVLYGIMHALIDGNQRAFVSDLAPDALRGTALGAFHSIIGLVELPASLIAGALWQYVGHYTVFIYGGAGSIIPISLFIIFRNSLIINAGSRRF